MLGFTAQKYSVIASVNSFNVFVSWSAFLLAAISDGLDFLSSSILAFRAARSSSDEEEILLSTPALLFELSAALATAGVGAEEGAEESWPAE